MTPAGRPPKDGEPRSIRKELRITETDADLIASSRRADESETDTMLRLIRDSARREATARYAKARDSLAKADACERCGKACKLHGHHADYSRPLDVQWLCPACHKIVGAEDGSHSTTRGPLFPSTDPWAALVSRGLISRTLASAYRTGAKVPGYDRREHWHGLGYEIAIVERDGKRRALILDWPEREVDGE